LIDYLYQRYHTRLLWDDSRLTLAQLQRYESAISRSCKGINQIGVLLMALFAQLHAQRLIKKGELSNCLIAGI